MSSAFLSYIFIAILVLLITGFDQGSVLIVDVLSRPINLLIFTLIFNVFALILGHYPTYIHKFRKDDDLKELNPEAEASEWHLSEFNVMGLGVITFKPVNNLGEETRTFKVVRKASGAIWHVAFIYILLRTYTKYFDEAIPIGYLAFGLLLVVLFAIWKLTSKNLSVSLKENLLKLASVSYYTGLIIGVVLIVSSVWYGWSPQSFFSLLIFEVVCLFNFILFSTLRSLFKDTVIFPLKYLSDHEWYLFFISCIGWLAMVIVVLTHFAPHQVSPIVLIVAYFIIYYGLVVIPIKHFFYYTTNDVLKYRFWRPIFNFVVNYAPVVLLLWALFSTGKGNDLHLLPLVDGQNEVSEADFIDDLEAKMTTTDDLYFISSYGGGLKANAWNLLLLNSWSTDSTRKRILEQSVSMSGVSGGALGLAFYTAMLQANDGMGIPDKIDRMAESNFLSIDIAYLLGYDLIREINTISTKFNPDRAMRAFAEYAEVIGDPSMNTIGFREYWAQVYQAKKLEDKFYPMLIVNSTGTHQKRGLATSIEFDNFEEVFPDSEDLLDHEHQTLTYGHAVSCANRFPIFSPAAKVSGKGHFLDGGYFENSGLLSSLSFHDYLDDQVDFSHHRVHFVNIVNDQNSYIRKLVEDLEIDKDESESGEITAIINTVASISMWPNYLRTALTQNQDSTFIVEEVFLPHKVYVEDLESMIMGELIDPIVRSQVEELFRSNNEKIDQAICDYMTDCDPEWSGWQAFEPPLARILTKPSVDYMRAMIAAGLCYPN